MPGWLRTYGASTRATRSCQVIVRLNPSNPTEPSATARNSTEPGVCSAPARPVSGTRSRIRPSRATNGAMRPMYAKRIAKPSPERIQVSRPKASIPNSATYE